MTNAKPARKMHWGVWLGASCVVLGLAGAAVWLKHSKSHRATANDASCSSHPTPRIGGEPGESVRYTLTYRAELCNAAQCTAILDLSAEVSAGAATLEQSRDDVVELRIQAKQRPDRDGKLSATLPSAEALATPAWVHYSHDGRVQSVRYERQIDEPTARMIESIARDLQAPVPTCWKKQTSWAGVENLVAANVMSEFRWESGTRQIRWSRERVLLWHDAEGIFPLKGRSSQATRSQQVAVLDEHGRVRERSGQDEFTLSQPSSEDGEIRLRTSVTLVPLGSERVAFAASPGSNPSAKEPGLDKPSAHSAVADEGRIAGHTVPSIMAALVRNHEVGEAKGTSRTRLFSAAAALFRRDAAAARQAAELVRQGHREKKFLLSALAEAGTTESARLLADMLDSASLRADALRALGRSAAADPSVVDKITAQFGDGEVGGTARLMAGSLAQRARDASPEASTQAVQALIKDYEAEQDVRVRADTLRGLGNAGDTAALALAQRAALSDNALERAAAAQALRRIPSDAADRILASMLDDSDPFVRRSVLDAAHYRDPTTLLEPSVERVARMDADANVRREAIRALVRWKDEVAPARATLAWVSQHDPISDLQKVAAEGLTRIPN
jgi:HEAT repeat protein